MNFVKRSLLIALVVVMGTVAASAQKNSIVGKWKVASLNVEGLAIDLENPIATRKLLSEQIQKETGKEPDSATLNMAYTMMTSIFDGMRMEFTASGKGIYVIPDPTSGSMKSDTASYTVDYDKGLLNTTSKEEGVEKKEQMTIKFDGDYLVMVKQEGTKAETIKLKRAKE